MSIAQARRGKVTALLQLGGRDGLSAVVVAVGQWSVVPGFHYLCADAAFTAPPNRWLIRSWLIRLAFCSWHDHHQYRLPHPKVQQMTTNRRHVISAWANIPAPPQRAYSIIANYLDEHPGILPSQFSNLAVEKGGIGAGTVIRFNMRVFGRKQSFRAAITEPEPGRVLVETDLDTNGAVTTFIVDSGAHPGQCQVTITTELAVRGGLLGKIERLLSTRLLHPIYVRELELLAARAAEKTQQ